MKRRFLVTVGFLTCLELSASATPQKTSDVISVDGICGKIVAKDAQQNTVPFDHARVRLFSPVAGSDCCVLMTAEAEVTTSRDGSFLFKKTSPGDYWLVATLAGKEYKILIRFEPGNKKGSLDCSRFVYTLEKGVLLLKSDAKAPAN